MRSLLILAILTALGGCVIAPPRYTPSVQVTVQPGVSGEVYFDAHVSLYFMIDVYNRRHYMPYGWRPYRRY